MPKRSKKTTTTTIKAGDEVRAHILDHVKGREVPDEYFVYGRVAKATPGYYVLDAWAQVDPKSTYRDQGDHIESFCILRVAIKSITRLAGS